MLYGAVETGGTKIICGVMGETGEMLDILRFPTDTPEYSVEKIAGFFDNHNICAVGIGSFGPVDVNEASETYGNILDTPKLQWRNYPFLQRLKSKMKIPMVIDTDVNCACIGEAEYGAGKGLDNVIYITVGTGIGVGVVVNGRSLKGMLHPEGGHILLRRNPNDIYEGKCPYHKDCFEGLASGPALAGRVGRPAFELDEDDPVWDIEADYIAQAVSNYILTYSPEKIIIGGGVLEQEHLFPVIRNKVKEYLNGYIRTPQLGNIEDYIVPAKLKGNQGLYGAYFLARTLAQKG